MLFAYLRNQFTNVFILSFTFVSLTIKANDFETSFSQTGSAVASIPDWKPSPNTANDNDWIELTSGEWIKGEIKYMYDEELVFDSDKLGDLTIDWDDIKQIKSPRTMNFRLNNRTEVSGIIHIKDGKLKIKGMDRAISPDEIVSMVPKEKNELEKWSISVNIGADFQSGNTDETSYSASAEFQRRTALTRFSLSYLGNYAKNDGTITTSNQRVNSYFDYFLDKKIFIRPVFAQYYHDPFQNISSQGMLGTGIGYQIYKSSTIEWDIITGPAYQVTVFDSVAAGNKEIVQTPAGLFITTISYDIKKDLTYDGSYQFIAMDKNSGLLSTHFVTTLTYEISDLFDVYSSLIWDRVQKPTEKSDGSLPKKNDVNLIFGLGISY